jgi:DNA-binding CsgD family transcriptional regulator
VHALLMIRAVVETERGEFDNARAHLDAVTAAPGEDRAHGLYDCWVAGLALWEHRFSDATVAINKALHSARSREAAQIRVQVCARGLRVQAELVALAGSRRDLEALATHLRRAGELLDIARRAASESAAVAPNTRGWLALAEAEHTRTCGESRPEDWARAADAWDSLERPPLAAYCRWREAETLVAAGASRVEAGVPLRDAYATAARTGAKPLRLELELLAERARLDLASPDERPTDDEPSRTELLNLTPREVEVLTLVARGYTNREIAAALVISVKTASVHVTHILHKLNAPNRREAAAIAHRLTPFAGSGSR